MFDLYDIKVIMNKLVYKIIEKESFYLNLTDFY